MKVSAKRKMRDPPKRRKAMPFHVGSSSPSEELEADSSKNRT